MTPCPICGQYMKEDSRFTCTNNQCGLRFASFTEWEVNQIHNAMVDARLYGYEDAKKQAEKMFVRKDARLMREDVIYSIITMTPKKGSK